MEVPPSQADLGIPLFKSLIFRLGIALAGIILLALASMVSSMLIAESSSGDAAAINLAGSLRMRSFQLATLLPGSDSAAGAARLERKLSEFEEALHSPVLTRLVPARPSHPLTQGYRAIVDDWERQIRPLLQRGPQDPAGVRAAYLQQVEGFVGRIDQMVSQVQEQAENPVQLLRFIQGLALFLTLGLVFFTMYKLLTEVMPPLRELLGAVNQARRGDLSARTTYQSGDELGLLAHTFNLMAEDLSHVYAQLEQRVEEKTQALTRSNRSLELLYETARQLGHESGASHDYRQLLEKVQQVVGLGSLTLCLTTEDADRAYRRITAGAGQPSHCQAPDCGGCLRRGIHGAAPPGALPFAVQESGRQFGVLLLDHPPSQRPEPWQVALLQAVASHVATAESLAQRREQGYRLALMEERAVIARELHDSLAQSLSYLKIQISRLQSLLNKGADRPALESVLAELREGTGSAYRQLRELLTTFRLRMTEPGLEPALQQTAAEFSERGELDILLDYRLGHCPLSPNEELHVLQIVREALANVLHHAAASRAEVRLETDPLGRVQVSVLDNGRGLPENWQRRNHYGLTIMQERAQTLGGEIAVEPRPEGGTRVLLSFMPDYTRNNAEGTLLGNSA